MDYSEGTIMGVDLREDGHYQVGSKIVARNILRGFNII